MTPHEVVKDSLEKKCLICGVGKPKIKYCPTKCTYIAINNKLKQRKMKKIKPIFRKGVYRDYQWRIKLFRHPYPYNNPENYIEAVFIQFGHKGYWLFRNKEIWSNWPAQA